MLASWLVARDLAHPEAQKLVGCYPLFRTIYIFIVNVCRSVHIIAAMTNKSRCVAQLQLAEGAAFTLWGLGSSPAGDFPFCVLFKPLMSFVFPSCDVHHRYKYLHVYIHTYKPRNGTRGGCKTQSASITRPHQARGCAMGRGARRTAHSPPSPPQS